jgi:hypothetical protein
MNRKTCLLTLGVVAAALMLPELASARDLGAAATSAVATAKTVARILSIFGIIVGGVLMQIPGLNEFGKRTVGAGCIGCLCAFGGPALISFFEGVFGAA